jgi:hypothetical protein
MGSENAEEQLHEIRKATLNINEIFSKEIQVLQKKQSEISEMKKSIS